MLGGINAKIILFILGGCLFALTEVSAQNADNIVKKAWALIDNGKHKEGYDLIRNISDEQANEFGDSCVMMLNYEKGTCLYRLKIYQDAIPFLKKALLYLEKMPHEDCNYLELIYGIGSCYNHLKDYVNAEMYFRRVIIRGNVQGFKCMITTQTLGELTEVYNKLGYEKLAIACADKINSKVNDLPTESWSNRAEGLLDLANSYEQQGKIDEEIDTYRKILEMIESHTGKTNEQYLTYCSILRYRLILHSRIDEAIPVLEDMIDIGKSYKIYNEDVCSAYEDYLDIMAKRNKVGLVEEILPDAIKYIQHTKDYEWQNHNLYEVIGIGLFEAKEYDAAIGYLEKKWNGESANSIKALDCLGTYYFRSEPAKALSYYKNAESQILNGLEVNDHTKQTIFECLMYLNERLGNLQEAIKYAELAEPFIIEMHNDTYYLRHLVSWATECINVNDIEKANQLMSKVEPLLNHGAIELNIGTLSNMGFVYLKSGKLERAISTIDKGIKLTINEKGEKCIELTTLYHNLGRAYMLIGDYSSALSALNKSKYLQLELEGEVMQRTADYIKECESK